MSQQYSASPVRTNERSPAPTDGERGDVPGWVLVTLMSALIIVALIAGFQGQLAAAFSNALNSVAGAGGG